MKPRMPDSPIAAIWRRRGIGKRGKREGVTNLLAEVDEFADGFEWELISALICCLFFIVTSGLNAAKRWMGRNYPTSNHVREQSSMRHLLVS